MHTQALDPATPDRDGASPGMHDPAETNPQENDRIRGFDGQPGVDR